MNAQPTGAGFSAHSMKNAGKRILSVDDEPGILFSRGLLLQNAGYEVVNAADGEQAIRSFLAQEVDLVLLDYLMPGMNGGLVAREMKSHKPQVPIVVISANPIPDETRQCVDSFLPKGEGPALLLQEIGRLLAPL